MPYKTCGRKYYNESEKNLILKEKEILNKFRKDGYNVSTSCGMIIIKW